MCCAVSNLWCYWCSTISTNQPIYTNIRHHFLVLCFTLSSAGWLLYRCQWSSAVCCFERPRGSRCTWKSTAFYSHILPCICHSACLAHLAIWPFMCFTPHLKSAPLPWRSLSWRCFLAMAGGTEQEAPGRSPNEIFPGFWWSASSAAIALEACLHWALARDQGELSLTA